MINEVRILAPNGKVKKVIPVKQLSNSHWKEFENQGNPFMLDKKKRKNGKTNFQPDVDIALFSGETEANQINSEIGL